VDDRELFWSSFRGELGSLSARKLKDDPGFFLEIHKPTQMKTANQLRYGTLEVARSLA
jgi:hypothetical protein